MLCIVVVVLVVVESIDEIYQLKGIEVTGFMCEVLCLSSKERSCVYCLPLLFTVAVKSEANIFSIVFVCVSPVVFGFP